MIAALKRAVLGLIGVQQSPAFGAGPDVRYLKDQGYRVHSRQGRWHWYRWDGTFGGYYTTERAAWEEAAANFERRKDEA